MSADNSIAQSSFNADPQERFDMPVDLVTRYHVRVVGTPGYGGRRLELFLPGDRIIPSLEIANDRITARNHDPETLDAILRMATHHHWDRIDAQGSIAFRRGVWEIGTLAGLTVNGYEPSVSEIERIARQGRNDIDRERETAESLAAEKTDIGQSKMASAALASDAEVEAWVSAIEEAAHSARPQKAGYPGRDRDEDSDRHAVNTPTLRAGETVAARETSMLAQGVQEIKRAGILQAEPVRQSSAIIDQIDEEQYERSASQSAWEPVLYPEHRKRQRGKPVDRHREDEAVAERFLRGALGVGGAGRRLSNIREAQVVMDQHIAEVFKENGDERATAMLESRQMIADALRRGLHVSVRKPTHVRQIEPTRSPTLER